MSPIRKVAHPRAGRAGARLSGAALLLLGLVAHAAPAHAQSDAMSDDAAERDGAGAEPGEPGEPGAPGAPGAEPRPWVEGVPVDTRLRAHRVFRDGNVLIKEGLFARAAARYQEAIALWDHPIFHYNLAIARINLDQPIGAYQSFQRALRYDGRALGPDRSEQARSFLTLLGNQLSRLEVTCDEPGAVVTLDGNALLTAPGRAEIMVLPGGHQLMADKPGRLPDNRRIVLAPGQRARFHLAPRIPDQLVTERRWPAWRPWAVAGAGALVVAAGGYLDWRSSHLFASYDRSVDSLCPGNDGCDPGRVPGALRRRREQAASWQWAARGVYLAGGAAAVTGAALIYLNRERAVRRRGRVETPATTLAPVLGPHMVGVSAGLEF